MAGSALLALKGIQGLKAGPVKTLFIQDSYFGDEDAEIANEELSNDYRRKFSLNEHSYVLRTSRGLTKDGHKVAILVLESNGIVQVIKQTRHFPTDDRDIFGSLLWVGDLNNDGRLDLYLDEFNEIGAFSGELYLSSEAELGKLVNLVALFGTAGC